MNNGIKLTILLIILFSLIYLSIYNININNNIPEVIQLNDLIVSNPEPILTANIPEEPKINPLQAQIGVKELPYVDENYLYTKSGKYPLSLITNIEVVTDPVRYVIFTVEYDKYKMTMFTMEWYDFKKIIDYFKQER